MNAITVNYAEVGNDHIPVSFGIVRNSDLTSQTVYNSKITKINDTYSILQGRDIGTKDVIVSSDAKISRLLNTFTSGVDSWIAHRLPNSDSTAYVFYKDDGYYYKIVEGTNGKPVQEKYAPYIYLTDVKNNDGSQPYCEAKIETPVTLQITDNSIKAVIDDNPVEIANTNAKLTLQLENVNDDNFTEQPVSDSEYTINNYFALDNIVWTRDNKSVSAWLSGNKIIKSFETVTGRTHQVKMLAGTNLVKLFRKQSNVTVNFTFVNNQVPSFEDGGASSNGKESSTMANGILTIPNVKHGRSQINLLDFFNNAQESWFSLAVLDGPISEQTTFNIDVKIPTPTDTLTFTGWLDGHLVQDKSIVITHKRLPQTITVDSINTENLSNIVVEDNGGLLVHAGGNKFTRSGDFSSQIFTATARYTDIPYTVDGDNGGRGAANQVVTFKGQNYVLDDATSALVKTLTNVEPVSLGGKKEVTYNDSSQEVEVTVTVNFGITAAATKTCAAEIKLIVQDFKVIKSQVVSIKENNKLLEGASLKYSTDCKQDDTVNFTCTVTVTKLTKSGGTEYTVNASGTKTGTVKTSTKQIFN